MSKKNNPNNEKYFDRLGGKFDEFMSDYDVQQRMKLIFTQLLADKNLNGKTVLEVGCGTGRFSKKIHELGAQLTIVDIGESLVKNVSETLSCKGIVADACDLPFEDNTFDFVISSECIEHTPNPESAIIQMCRVCKPSGTVCLTTPNKLWYPVLYLSKLLGIRKFAGTENWIFPCKAVSIMSRHNMKDIKLSGCHLWPFQLKFTRKLLIKLDGFGSFLFPFMINFGIRAKKG